jgi:hypothetical protein
VANRKRCEVTVDYVGNQEMTILMVPKLIKWLIHENDIFKRNILTDFKKNKQFKKLFIFYIKKKSC